MNNKPNSNQHLDFIIYADDTTLDKTIEFSLLMKTPIH